MGEKENVTTMVLKVDLQCDKCYKKVKKVLFKIPQIRDQKYDEKQNQVEIKVVSSCPEKIRDKIYCRGGCCINCIEIKKPETKPEKKPETQPETKPEPDKTKSPQTKPEPDKTKNPPPVHVNVFCTCIVCSQGHPGWTCYRGSGCGQGPNIWCDGFCGRPVCDSCCGRSKWCGVTRPYCCSEEKCSDCRKPACDSYCEGSRGCSEANPCPIM